MVSVTWIKRFDGDWGTHCNSCEHLAVYSVSLAGTSFRLCASCAEKLCTDLDGVLAMKVRKPKRQPTPRAADGFDRALEEAAIVDYLAEEERD